MSVLSFYKILANFFLIFYTKEETLPAKPYISIKYLNWYLFLVMSVGAPGVLLHNDWWPRLLSATLNLNQTFHSSSKVNFMSSRFSPLGTLSWSYFFILFTYSSRFFFTLFFTGSYLLNPPPFLAWWPSFPVLCFITKLRKLITIFLFTFLSPTIQ